MERILECLKQTTEFLIHEGIIKPTVGIVLGTGLGALVNKMTIKKILPYQAIPNFPLSTVEFHKGALIYGSIGDKEILLMQGRFHYYEGYSMQQITFPVRVMKQLGIGHLLLSNAAGGLKTTFKKGDLVLIKDHINLHPDNPLRGLNDPAFGNRFVDMSAPYDISLNKQLNKAAALHDIKLKKGVYVAVAGPNLETKAEYKYLHRIGADMVGMSTVPEVIVCNHTGIKCAAISVITDECNPKKLRPVDIAEIIKVAGEADEVLSGIFVKTIENMDVTAPAI